MDNKSRLREEFEKKFASKDDPLYFDEGFCEDFSVPEVWNWIESNFIPKSEAISKKKMIEFAEWFHYGLLNRERNKTMEEHYEDFKLLKTTLNK